MTAPFPFAASDLDAGTTADFLDALAVASAERFAVDMSETPFLLSDAELDALSEDIDAIPADAWDDAISDPSVIAPF